VSFILAVFLIFFRSHEIIDFTLILYLQLDEPSIALSLRVDKSGLVRKLIVDLSHCSRYRSIDIRGGLDRLDTAKRITLFELITDIRKINKDNVTKCSLSKVSDTANSNVSLNLYVFVG